MNVHRNNLSPVRYLDVSRIGARTVEILPLWDGKQWCIWVPTRDGLRELHPTDAMDAMYVGIDRAAENDLCVPLLHNIWQRATWDPVVRILRAVCDDIDNLGTALAKVDHFFGCRESIGHGVSSFVETEIEYIFVVARSIFDLTHELIRYVWKEKVTLRDEARNKAKKRASLPDSFAKMALIGDKPRTTEELCSTYAFSEGLAAAYSSVADFFLAIRTFRTAVVHGGTSPDIVFVTERGFCVERTKKPFCTFPTLDGRGRHTDSLSSLKVLLSHVVFNSINSCNKMVNGLLKNIKLAPEIAPNYHVFIRGPHNGALVAAKNISEGAEPWTG